MTRRAQEEHPGQTWTLRAEASHVRGHDHATAGAVRSVRVCPLVDRRASGSAGSHHLQLALITPEVRRPLLGQQHADAFRGAVAGAPDQRESPAPGESVHNRLMASVGLDLVRGNTVQILIGGTREVDQLAPPQVRRRRFEEPHTTTVGNATPLRLSFAPPAQSPYPSPAPGRYPDMIGAAAGFLLLGVIFLFVIPWVGVVAGASGLVLLFLFALGFGRRAAGHRASEPQ